MESFGFGFGTIVIVVVVIYILSSIKILAEYERGVIFRLGRLLSTAKGPGVALVFAPIDRIVRVSLRQEALEVPPQDIITRDNVTLKVNAVIFLRVIDPNKAVVEVSNYVYQTSQFAQTTLRSVLGEQELDELLSHREKINLRLQSILDQHTSPWGVKVTNVEVKQVDMPESMLRAMAKQAEAEREKRSKIIHAEGEFSAAQRLVDAAHLLATEPVSVQLRYLQTLTEIGVEKNTTVIFPVPVDFFSGLQKLLGSGDGAAAPAPAKDCVNGVERWLLHKIRKLRWGRASCCSCFSGWSESARRSLRWGIRWGGSPSPRSPRRARRLRRRLCPARRKRTVGRRPRP